MFSICRNGWHEIVAVIAGALIIMSVLLVTITMRMSDHIDEMGEYITLTKFSYRS